ncbi:MAG: hypothetical protein CXX80_03340 [Methanobacteriota archaeon]|nr:MAG: hypothetical protein CXX80_03340 [Euryarchaeota archaeon]
METIGFFEVVLAVLWAVSSTMIYQRLKARTVELESMLLGELEHSISSVSESIETQLSTIGDHVREAADIDPLDAIELFRQNIINQFMTMGVEWVGNKFGQNMGVHQIETPDAPAEIPGPTLEDFN